MYEPVIDWGDPGCRLGLIENVGIDEYNRLFAEHRERLAHEIRPAHSTPHPKLSILKRIRAARYSASDPLNKKAPAEMGGASPQSGERSAQSSLGRTVRRYSSA